MFRIMPNGAPRLASRVYCTQLIILHRLDTDQEPLPDAFALSASP